MVFHRSWGPGQPGQRGCWHANHSKWNGRHSSFALLHGSGNPCFGPELSFCISTMSFSLLYPHFPIDLPLSHLNPALVARVLIPSPRASHFRFLFNCCLLQITLSTTLSLALEPSMVFSYKISPPPPGPSFTRTIF